MSSRKRSSTRTVQMTLARAFKLYQLATQQIHVNRNASSLVELIPEDDVALRHMLAEAESTFFLIRDRRVWAATFSGGKDSMVTVVLAIEFLKRNPDIRPKLVVLHADTLMEAPPMEEYARHVLLDVMVEECQKHGIDVEVRITTPPIEDDFWTMYLGYGYPPFSKDFRPCTARLKIKPNANALLDAVKDMTTPGSQAGDHIALLLGVRMAESEARREGLTKICNLQDGECGQILDAPEYIPGDIMTVAPIINARTCKVWDTNMFVLPELGWPTAQLAEIYGDDVVRFGCWMCSVASQVKDVENLMQVPEYAYLGHMWRFRMEYLDEAQKDENRLFMTLEDKEAQLQRKRDKLGEQLAAVNTRILRAAESGKDTMRLVERRDKVQSKIEAVKMRKITTGDKGVKRGMTMAFRKRWHSRLLDMQERIGRQLVRPEVLTYIDNLWHIEETTGRRGKSGRAAGRELA